MEDSRGRINYYCKYCILKDFKTQLIDKIKDHVPGCKSYCENNLTEGVDYVVCKICNFHCRKLGTHLKDFHNLTSKDYVKIYNGEVLCKNSYEEYKKNIINITGCDGLENWITKSKRLGIDISEKLKLSAKKTSETIMANPAERLRRSNLIKEIVEENLKDPDYIKFLSENAKKTSSRPEILEQRSAQLKNWRDNNPEEFYEKCTKKMLKSFNSKPERKLFEFLKFIDNFSFTRNHFIEIQNIENKSHKKQIDIGDKYKNIFIEFDGVYHFEPIFGEEKLQNVQILDKSLEDHVLKQNWILIRVADDQFVDKNKYEKSYFKKECLNKIKELLNACNPGIYKIGERYAEILKV